MALMLTIFALTYVLIASEKVDKAVAAGLGATAMILLHFVSGEKALEHIDLNVIFLLVGMMLMMNVLSKTGIFEWISVVIAQTSKGNGLLILLLFLVVTAVLSAFLDNVTTVILVAPITILITEILEIPTVQFLALEAIFSNIGGTATLVGDPPNVLIGSQANLSFNDFLINLGPVVIFMLLVLVTGTTLINRRVMATRAVARRRIDRANAALAIRDHAKLYAALMVFGLVMVGFFLGRVLEIEPGIVALSGGLLMVLLTKSDIHDAFGKVEWTTIFFFIGLFMLVGALQENGVFAWLGHHMLAMTGTNRLYAAIAILWGVAAASAIVDNIPMVIAMIPLLQSMEPTFSACYPHIAADQVMAPLYWALALGACLGGNGTLVGASANVIVAQIARKNNYTLTFWQFTRTGLPFMITSLVICTVYLYLRYFRFPG